MSFSTPGEAPPFRQLDENSTDECRVAQKTHHIRPFPPPAAGPRAPPPGGISRRTLCHALFAFPRIFVSVFFSVCSQLRFLKTSIPALCFQYVLSFGRFVAVWTNCRQSIWGAWRRGKQHRKSLPASHRARSGGGRSVARASSLRPPGRRNFARGSRQRGHATFKL
jgi:hypothetical protein